MKKRLIPIPLLLLGGLFWSLPVGAGVRGHSSVYVGGTLTSIDKGSEGVLDTADKAPVFSPKRG